MKDEHPDSKAALQAAARSKKAADLKSQSLFTFGVMSEVKQNTQGKSIAIGQSEVKPSSPFVLTAIVFFNRFFL